MSSKKPVLVLIALMALIANTTAAVAFAAPAEVAFHPAPGEPHDYRVGMRVQVDGGKRSSSGQWLALQSVMRYRVTGDGPTLKMHIEPRFMRAENDSKTLFSSARSNDLQDTAITRLMGAGFDLSIDRNSKSTRLYNSNREAWNAIAGKTGAPVSHLEQQLLVPALAQTIPARRGAQITIDSFQGMPALRLTVVHVDSDSLTATFTRADDVPRPAQPMSGTCDCASALVTDVDGRMRIDRDSGWIQAMTMISDRQIERSVGTERLHSVVTMQAVDDPATGAMYDGLREFKTNALQAALPDSDMYLPETAEDALERPVVETSKQPLAHAETDFHIDDEDGALVLTITHHDDENVSLDHLSLDALTLRGANGKTLDQGFVLDSIAPDFEQYAATRVRLLPLGWQPTDLSDIAEVAATFTYQPASAPSYVSLPLRDTPTQLEDGAAHARAVPIDDGWLVTLTGSYRTYYTYGLTAVFKGRSARTTNRGNEGIAYADRVLLERVDEPDVWGMQIELTGDIDAFDLMFYSAQAKASTHQLTFSRDAQGH